MNKTHGELWYEKKKRNNERIGFDKFDTDKGLPHRMSRAKATLYYNEKCRKVFESLGYLNKIITNSFEKLIDAEVLKVKKTTYKMIKREIKKNNILYMESVA